MFLTNMNFSKSLMKQTTNHLLDLKLHKKELSNCSKLVDNHDLMNDTVDFCKAQLLQAKPILA
jgi:hypothetical protein